MAARMPKIPKIDLLHNSSMDNLPMSKSKGEQTHDEVGKENINTMLMEIDFSVLEPFPNHRFRLYTGQRLADMVQSIKEYGILQPITVWRKDGRYILLSGHNRVNAGKIAGLTKCNAIVRENISYEDAMLIVTETNLRQRSFENMSFSERAICLKQHYDAIKSQGRRTDLLKEMENLANPHGIMEKGTLSQNPKKLDAGASVSEEYGLSKDRIARYLRIATLITPLLECLDTKVLGFEAAYNVSFAKEEMQSVIAKMIIEENLHIDTKKSALLRDYAQNSNLTEECVRQIITGEKTRKPRSRHLKPIKLNAAVVTRFFPGEQSQEEIENTIVKALEEYFAYMNGNNESIKIHKANKEKRGNTHE